MGVGNVVPGCIDFAVTDTDSVRPLTECKLLS